MIFTSRDCVSNYIYLYTEVSCFIKQYLFDRAEWVYVPKKLKLPGYFFDLVPKKGMRLSV